MGSPPGAGLLMPWRASIVGKLFEWGRGMEPLRVAVGPQRLGTPFIASAREGGSTKRRWFEPMPVVFG
jgi:hypothetical protein